MGNEISNKAGIYVHIPFCRSRCSYCDFATAVYRNQETVERYVNALCREISNSRFQIPHSKDQRSKIKDQIDTIYFGGGTPSLLLPVQLERILNVLHEKFSVDKNSGITVEMNPTTVSPDGLRDFKRLGVNRASFGVQTFNDLSLKMLARGHNADDARATFKLLRKAGFENISFDLIAGLPHQTLEDWERNLSKALSLHPEHLSLYLLEIHEGTPLAEQIRSGRQPLPDEELAGEMYGLMLEKCASAGYRQYEISNFCRPNFESRHNSKYWQFAPYYGFGVSAHSLDGCSTRWANERDTAKYVLLIENDKSTVVEKTCADEKTQRGEYIFLRLRLNEGIDLNEFEKKFGIDLIEEYKAELENLREARLIELDNKSLRLSKKGMLYSNEVFSRFV